MPLVATIPATLGTSPIIPKVNACVAGAPGANLVTGESGQRFSTHYKDQWDAYLQGRTFAMPFNHVNAKDVLSVNPAQ